MSLDHDKGKVLDGDRMRLSALRDFAYGRSLSELLDEGKITIRVHRSTASPVQGKRDAKADG